MNTDNEAVITLDDTVLTTWGSGSLIGYLGTPLPSNVVIEFLQTSTGWRAANGGPAQWIINEFIIPCLLKDILHLVSLGCKVSIREKTKEIENDG
jgi:hypothetical protein